MPSFETWFEALTPEEQRIAKANLVKAEKAEDEGPPPFGAARMSRAYSEANDPSEVRRQRRESGS